VPADLAGRAAVEGRRILRLRRIVRYAVLAVLLAAATAVVLLA
jgi:hypothetical protein